MDEGNLQQACLKAEELAEAEGPEQAMAVLKALTAAHPTRSEPRISLAKLHRWLGLRDMHKVVDRAELRMARRLLLTAVQLDSPPDLETLTLLRETTHDLALHEEQASYFSDLAQQDPRPRVRFQSLSWVSVALECRGKELAATGELAGATACYEQSVASHRQALDAWPDAPVTMRLACLLGGSHTVGAYAEAGRHAEWISLAEAELDSSDGHTLPVVSRIECLLWASDMAFRGKLHAEAVQLAERALDEWKAASDSVERSSQLRVEILGQLLLAHKGLGNRGGKAEAVAEIQRILSDVERTEAENPNDLKECYSLASRHFVVAEEWDVAIQTARRATEVWDFGPNWAFLAAALWVGARDRQGALDALRNAARDARLSGRGQCRNLRDDFLRSEHFTGVHNDPEFLNAVEVDGILD